MPDIVLPSVLIEDDSDEIINETKEVLFAKYGYVLKGKKNATYQYVLILNTLNALFKHQEIIEAYFKSIPTYLENNNLIRNFYDSNLFKKNDLFSLNINGIQLTFFIDGYSNTNPLADARHTYKVTGIYFRIGNLPKEYQSLDYATQLGILVYDTIY